MSETAFSFSPNEYISIHRKLFQGIYKHAGKIRDYNITKKEWFLDGATVLYGSASELRATLEYDFSQEKSFCYKGLSMDDIIHHLAVFLRNLLLNEKNKLHNRHLHISRLLKAEKVDIQNEKVDIESVLSQKAKDFSGKTINHIRSMFEKFGYEEIFGRSAVASLLKLQTSSASKLIAKLVQAGIIGPVSGCGKGKYRFLK